GFAEDDDERGFEIFGAETVTKGVEYRILVRDENDEFIGEFETFQSLKWSKRLNNFGQAEFRILADDPKAQSLVSLRRYSVWIYRYKNGVEKLVWSGEQAMRGATLREDRNNWVTIHCSDWLEKLRHRY